MANTNEKAQPKYYHAFDADHKNLHQSIDNAVNMLGWKTFVFAVLKYQKEVIKSNYKLLKSWD